MSTYINKKPDFVYNGKDERFYYTYKDFARAARYPHLKVIISMLKDGHAYLCTVETLSFAVRNNMVTVVELLLHGKCDPYLCTYAAYKHAIEKGYNKVITALHRYKNYITPSGYFNSYSFIFKKDRDKVFTKYHICSVLTAAVKSEQLNAYMM